MRDLVVELALHPADGVELVFERVALLHHALGAGGVVPERGVFGLRVQLGEARLGLSKSKMPPQQSNRPLDVFDQLFGFGAHDSLNLPLAGRFSDCGAARNRAFPPHDVPQTCP